MRVLAAHENLDFDALGALLLARRLFPGVTVLLGGLEGRMKEVVALFSDHLDLVPASELDLSQVTEVVLLDNARPERIGPLKRLLGRVPFLVFDHHPPSPGDLPAVGGVVRPVGATVSLLVPLLKAQGIRLTPLEATLAYAGLWEDTGGFSFPSTTEEDLLAGAFLLSQGAEPSRVRDWLRERYPEEARALLAGFLRRGRILEVEGFRLLLVQAKEEGYIPALAPLAHTLLDLFDAHGVLMSLRLGRDTLFIARSKERLDVGRWLSEVGGGGHPRAAFARVRGVRNALKRLLDALPRHLEPPLTLADRMTGQVETLPPTTVREALALLTERGYGGMPVVEEGRRGVRVLGIARRRDLEKAVRHGLGHLPVTSFLSRAVVLSPETPLAQAERALKTGVGRVLVGEGVGEGEYRLLGIFTRTDLYRGMPSGKAEPSPEEAVFFRLPEGMKRVLEALEEARFKPSLRGIYLVGGVVRDALGGFPLGPDLDLVLEGAPGRGPLGLMAEEVARFLAGRFGGSFSLHQAFGTAQVRLSLGLVVDIAETREEHYPYPGALPRVRPGSVAKDLERRDFTVNAMALALGQGSRRFFDPYGGLSDLRARLLRPLHPLSFVEDPTRILRGARLAARLGFRLAEEAFPQLGPALMPKVLGKVSGSRLMDELLLILKESRPSRALRILEDWGALGPLLGLRPVEEGFLEKAPDPVARLLLLLYLQEDLEALSRRLALPRRVLEWVRLLKDPPPDPAPLREEPVRSAFLALFPQKEAWLYQEARRLKGRDLLALGLSPGPKVGEVLRRVEEARKRGEVKSFEEELELARKLIGDGASLLSQ
ncbi:MAG: CBS domain-containing protein [Thermaceae bacterium]